MLVRPAVEAGEHLGFLPGDLEAKINPYLRPLLDALHDLMDYDQIRRYMGNDLIEIAPLAYMRGRTLNDAVIILDEGQNATVVADEDVPDPDGGERADRRDGRRDAGRPADGDGQRSGRRGRAALRRAGGRDRLGSTARISSGTRWCRRSSTPMKPRPRRPRPARSSNGTAEAVAPASG